MGTGNKSSEKKTGRANTGKVKAKRGTGKATKKVAPKTTKKATTTEEKRKNVLNKLKGKKAGKTGGGRKQK